VEFGTIVVAINNIASKCQLAHTGSDVIADNNLVDKLQLIQVCNRSYANYTDYHCWSICDVLQTELKMGSRLFRNVRYESSMIYLW
jgi:hypothetical protein